MSDESSIDQTMSDTLASIESSAGGGNTDVALQGGGDNAYAIPKFADQQAAQPEAWQQPPRSWRTEMRSYWGQQPVEVQKYWHEREDQFHRGLTQYKQQVEQWNNTLKPYDGYVKQYNLNPQEVVGNALAAHTILRFGTPEQRAAAAQMLDKDYGLRQYFQQNGQVAAPQGPDLTPIQNQLAALQAEQQRRALGDATSEVEKFISDPTNKFASDAAPRMLALLEAGRADNLKEAYDIATRTDPALFERIIAERVEAATRGARPAPPNVRPSGVPRQPTGAARGTVEDTMRATLADIQSR